MIEEIIEIPQAEIKHVIDNRTEIHPTAKIADNVNIGPWTIIGPKVEIGEGTWVGPHVVVNGPTKIGRNNKIFQFASIGEAPQDKKYRNEDTSLEIGDNNVIREYCTVNRGTVGGGGITKIGNYNWLLAYVHIAHDCIIGNETVIANNAQLAGHVQVDNYATIGAFVGIHQFCHIGSYCYIARATYIPKDILPYVLVAGYTPTTCGLNTVGLKRRGFSNETIDYLRRAYKIIFRQGLTVNEAVAELKDMLVKCPEIELFIKSLLASERGIVR